MEKISIFKPYDIRGVYPAEINEEIVYKIGQAIVKYLKCSTVVVGRDMRLSSDSLFNALARGIISQGADVLDIGLSNTPMFYYAVNILESSAGAIITASHNPKEYNGLKIVKIGAEPIVEDGIKEIERLVNENFEDAAKKGVLIRKDITRSYLSYLERSANKIKPLKVVVDCGNGMAGKTVPELLKALKIDAVMLFSEPDGSFPNHEANPLKPENTLVLQKKVVEFKADLGCAFDGDVDRIIFVDERGERISGDIMTALIAREILSKRKEKVLYDLRSTKAVPEIIREGGGTPVISRVGHSFIKEKMRRDDIFFAGEISGHYYFKENFFTDSAELALIRVLNLLSSSKMKLSEFVKPIMRYYHSGEINRNVHDKTEVLRRVESFYKEGRISKIDGLTVEFADWWFNLRESNTEPVIRLNLEAKTDKLLKEKLKEVLELIK